MNKNEFGDFWIPPEQKKDHPYIPSVIPIPDQIPPDFDPDQKKDHPDMGDDARKTPHKEPEEKISERGTVVIGDDEPDDRDWSPLKDDDEL